MSYDENRISDQIEGGLIAQAEAEKEHLKAVMAGFDRELEKHTRYCLNEKGFTFANDQEFEAFCKDRLTNATFEGIPFADAIYLDYTNFDNPGTLLFVYRNEFKTTFENGILTTSIG